MAPDDWAREAPGNQRRLETWEGELVSAVRPSTPLSKASLWSLYLVSWRRENWDEKERRVPHQFGSDMTHFSYKF